MTTRLKVLSRWQANNLIFCSEVGTPLGIAHLTYHYFRPLLEKAKLPQIRHYDLRHSQTTILLMADENPKVVSERLRHFTVRLTLATYSQVLPTIQERATDKWKRCCTERMVVRPTKAEKLLFEKFRVALTSRSADCVSLAAGKLLRIKEAAIGIEPMDKGFADLCLTTWLCRPKTGDLKERRTEMSKFRHRRA